MKNTPTNDTPNRRRSKRIRDGFVTYYDPRDNHDALSAFINDISLRGLCIFSNKNFSSGSILKMTVSLMGVPSDLEVTGKVVWSTLSDDYYKYKVGIKLISTKLTCAKMLCRHISLFRQSHQMIDDNHTDLKDSLIDLSIKRN